MKGFIKIYRFSDTISDTLKEDGDLGKHCYRHRKRGSNFEEYLHIMRAHTSESNFAGKKFLTKRGLFFLNLNLNNLSYICYAGHCLNSQCHIHMFSYCSRFVIPGFCRHHSIQSYFSLLSIFLKFSVSAQPIC